MHVRILITLLLLQFCIVLKGQSKEKMFQFKFNLAKHELSQRRMIKALPTLLELHEMDSTNANINYLIGVCFVEGNIITEKSIQFLLKSIPEVKVDYDSDSYLEKHAPIYAHYYLSIAYSQNKECEKAKLAQDRFIEIYTYEDQYYPNESKHWIEQCELNDELIVSDLGFLKQQVTPLTKASVSDTLKLAKKQDTATDFVDKVIHKVKPARKAPKVITRDIEYTTTMPLYGVQVGAFKEIVPVRRFSDLKNVDAFVDKEGWVRYVIGHFSYRSQAESLKEVIIRAGYPDIFIVDVNSERKYVESVVSIDNMNLKSVISGTIEFKVQLGAFKSAIPKEIAETYLKISHIEEFQKGDYTFITSPSYPRYAQAIKAKDQYVRIGVSDAFIVAFNKKKKIPLIEALNYTHENPITILQ